MKFWKKKSAGKELEFYAECNWKPIVRFWREWWNLIYILKILLWMLYGVIDCKGMSFLKGVSMMVGW